MSPLQKIRLEKKLTQEQVAELIGVDGSTISRIENGEIWPSKHKVESLISLFDKRINELEILWPERFR